ncbi:hypothetical protein EJB05_36168 [Eragrostis curvula]|uniref:Uncharacterized protein n=1 Tax=Eragrostis curvula TaxID=38414 RepID=A0A5J9U8E5_9POAL|nr:hypothetical protein EJB05_36168 [Eragrostis curvula]
MPRGLQRSARLYLEQLFCKLCHSFCIAPVILKNEPTESDVGGAVGEPELENVSVEPAAQGKHLSISPTIYFGEDKYVYGYFYPAEGGDGQE